MDRDILAPGPDLHWHISKLIDPRRSNGERKSPKSPGNRFFCRKIRLSIRRTRGWSGGLKE